MGKAIDIVKFESMYSKPALAFKYCKYLFTAASNKGHGVHSPFLFDFIERVLNDDRQFYFFHQIERTRKNLLRNKEVLTIEDFGAGSVSLKTKQRSVASIAATSLKPKKYSQLFFRMIDYYQPQNILEIGSSLGITTSYLASANLRNKVITLEGSREVAGVAGNLFKKLQLTNIELIEGNFDDTLSIVLEKLPKVDFAFIDGNHRYKPTIDYFLQILSRSTDYSIIILDDIHWSKEMEDAWNWVKEHESVTMTVDLFFIGIVFLRKEFLKKQHFSIRF